MKKLLLVPIFLLVLYSCSPEEETQAPTSNAQTITPEPETVVVQYTFTVSSGDGGTVSTEGGTFDEGTEVTITAIPDEGYEFVGWEGSDIDSTSLSVTLNADTTIQATFSRVFTLEINQTEGGSVNEIGNEFIEGSVILIEATPSDGFEFIEWSDGSTDNPLELSIISNTELTPLFQRKIDLISKHSGKIFIGEVDQYGNQYERYFTRDTIFGRTSYVDPIDGSKLCWDQAFTNVSIYSDPLQEVYQDSIVSSAGFIISDAYLDTLGTRNGVVKIVNSNILKYITTETYYTGEIYKIESNFTLSESHVCDELSF